MKFKITPQDKRTVGGAIRNYFKTNGYKGIHQFILFRELQALLPSIPEKKNLQICEELQRDGIFSLFYLNVDDGGSCIGVKCEPWLMRYGGPLDNELVAYQPQVDSVNGGLLYDDSSRIIQFLELIARLLKAHTPPESTAAHASAPAPEPAAAATETAPVE